MGQKESKTKELDFSSKEEEEKEDTMVKGKHSSNSVSSRTSSITSQSSISSEKEIEMNEKEEKKRKEKGKEYTKKSKVTSAGTPEGSSAKATATLLKHLKDIKSTNPEDVGFSVDPVGENMYKWNVRFFGWDVGSTIAEDLFIYESATGRNHVLLEILFPGTYPHDPPFMRVVYPRFHQYTGHITSGGAICIKDLTKSGWQSDYHLEPFIIMIRNLLLEGNALVDMDNVGIEYTEAEARESFGRVAKSHEWI